ncbi:hypothetical protein [uncultured Microbacterium sp.]|nr:hypothetical protein [uncultured Microbacterium sp.]
MPSFRRAIEPFFQVLPDDLEIPNFRHAPRTAHRPTLRKQL